MSSNGYFTSGLPSIGVVTGLEKLPIDTRLDQGVNPASEAASLNALAMALQYLMSKADVTPVAGTRYYASVDLASKTQITGVQYLIGATGGTDKAIVELHDSAGNLLATSALAGVTVGTANTFQQIPFTSPWTIPEGSGGTYFLVVQLNGTTARLQALHAPTGSAMTGSATGTFGTSASITPPTTYTQNVGPIASIY